MNKKNKFILATMITTFMMLPITFANSLNEITVTAHRVQENELDTPVATSVITKEQIKQTGAESIFDALSFITGITTFAYGSDGLEYGGMQSRVNLRGFDRGTLILVNGAPISVAGKSSLESIALDNINRIEISKGSNAVLYGPEAIGGVINILTKTGDNPLGKLAIKVGDLNNRKYSFNYGNKDFFFEYNENKIGRRNHATSMRPKTKRGEAYYNNVGDVKSKNIALSLQANDRLSINLMRNEKLTQFEKIALNAKTKKAIQKNDKIQKYKDEKNNFDITYQDLKNKTKIIGYYHSRLLNAKEHKGLVGVFKDKKSSNYRANNFGVDIQKAWEFKSEKKGKKDTLVAGVSIEREGYTGHRNKTKLEKNYPEYKTHRENIGTYLQYTHQYNNKISTTIGMRGEFIKDPVKDKNVFIPQVQTLYKVNDKTSYYINVGKTFEMPELKDMQKTADNRLIRKISGINLQPEEGWNYEFGYKHITDKDKLNISLYYMDMDNLFGWYSKEAKDKNTVEAIRINNGKFKNLGAEIDYARKVSEHVNINMGITVSNPRNKVADANWKQTYPKLQYHTSINYQEGKWNTSLALNYIGKRNFNELLKHQIKPLLNINAVFRYRANKNDEFTFKINNILNRKNIVSNGNYEWYGMPRHWSIEYTHKF